MRPASELALNKASVLVASPIPQCLDHPHVILNDESAECSVAVVLMEHGWITCILGVPLHVRVAGPPATDPRQPRGRDGDMSDGDST